MNQPLVTLRIDSGIAELTLNRPDKRNALTRGLLEQASESVAQVANDPDVRLLVLSATGTVFCAGMDLAEMQQRATQPDAKEQWALDARVYRDLLVAIFQLPIPTVCVVQGPAVAGGVGLVAACDLVLATDRATFSLPEPKRGITAAVVAPLVLYRIGTAATSALLLSGKAFTADEALRSGFCHWVVATDDLDAERRNLCNSILTGSPAALAITKQHLQNCTAQALLEQLETGMQISGRARESSDAREGLAAFLEKRDPSWIVRGTK